MSTKQNETSRIDVYDDAARSGWAKRLGISESKLREVVRRFGTRVSTVRASLGLPPA